MGAGNEVLAAAVIAALRQHAPFDEMDAASLCFLAGRLCAATLANVMAGSGHRWLTPR